MKLRIRYSGQARSAAGCAFEAAELSSAATLHDLLAEVARRHGEKMAALLEFKPHGAPAVLVFVGEEQVAWAAPPVLKDGDEIMLVSPISGG
jgi:molybdopterin converting factor small subunit